MRKPGWLARLQFVVEESTWDYLHHKSNSFQFLLNHLKRAACALDPAGCITSCLRRYSVAATDQKHLQELRGFAAINAALQQVITQCCKLGTGKLLNRHTVTSDPCFCLLDSVDPTIVAGNFGSEANNLD